MIKWNIHEQYNNSVVMKYMEERRQPACTQMVFWGKGSRESESIQKHKNERI